MISSLYGTWERGEINNVMKIKLLFNFTALFWCCLWLKNDDNFMMNIVTHWAKNCEFTTPSDTAVIREVFNLIFMQLGDEEPFFLSINWHFFYQFFFVHLVLMKNSSEKCDRPLLHLNWYIYCSRHEVTFRVFLSFLPSRRSLNEVMSSVYFTSHRNK